MRILFAGSPSIAVPSLQLLAKHHDVVAVLTNPPSAKGRGKELCGTDVALEAEKLGIPVICPAKLNALAREAVSELKPELLVAFAYGKLFGPKFMALFPNGGINAHPSLLPKWRGCAPIPFAIFNKDKLTGVSIQKIAAKMDAGDILCSKEIILNDDETCESLSQTAAMIGSTLLLDTVNKIEKCKSSFIDCVIQDDNLATYCHELKKEDGKLDFSLSAIDLDAKIRAFYPWPGSFVDYNGQRLSIIKAKAYPDESSAFEIGTVINLDKSRGIMVQTGKGLLALQCLQLQGKKAMQYKDFANGARGFVGSKLQ